jgi:segregation and condensation protein A
LLHLIEHQELDITAISLSEVADQYLEKVDTLRKGRFENLMDFLVIAAKLLVIKSRALLPEIPQEHAEEDDEEDPAEALARQLREYKRFKIATSWLHRRSEDGMRTYLRVAVHPRIEQNLDLSGVSIETLFASLNDVLDRSDLKEDSVSVATRKRLVTIDDQIRRLRTTLRTAGHVFFSQLLSETKTWNEVSVTLLAILELIKRHEISVSQPELFGPIEILPREN